MRHATPARGMRPCSADGWAILADPPGRRDLAEDGYWQASLDRSRRRRDIRREPRLIAHGRARASIALAAAAIGGPATGVASAEVSQTQAGSLGSANLSVGSRGDAVMALQRALGITADGVFGPQTRAAVVSFQRAHGVPATGLVGPLTRAALAQSSPAGTSAPASSAPAPVASISRSTIKAMQGKLGVTADGVIGPQTRSALRSFEASHGLTADGQPDSTTLKALGVDPAATTTTPAPAATQGSSKAASAVQAALSKVGSPYSYGAAGPSSFDCSGLVMWALRQVGISVPHSSYAQYQMGSPVSSGAIQAGDLVFFNTAGSGASDVGMATGPNRAVSATTHGVMEHSITTGYWGSHFVGARRL